MLTRWMRLSGLIFLTGFVAGAAVAAAQPVTVEAEAVEIESKPVKVTVFPDRAIVTRVAELEFNPGAYDLQFTNLPGSILRESLQARTTGSARVLEVKYDEKMVTETPDDRLRELDDQIQKIEQELQYIQQDREELAARRKTLTSISERLATTTAEQAGTAELNVDSLTAVAEMIAERRQAILESERELDARKTKLDTELAALKSQRQAISSGARYTARTATVQLAVTDSSPVTVELLYQVSNAQWRPRYDIRASSDGSTATIEYGAVIAQRTGEDWDEVEMTISTARPTITATPPTLEPIYVRAINRDEVRSLGRPQAPARYAAEEPPASAVFEDAEEKLQFGSGDGGFAAARGMARAAAADASAESGAVAVTYRLPRRVTVETDATQEKRTRIASIDATPEFTYLAKPVASPHVYLRGDLVNTSDYHLLPGKASIFFEGDFVGSTALESVAPGAEFETYFGVDPRVTVERMMLTADRARTGFGNSHIELTRAYRLSVANDTGRAIDLELWEVGPKSQDERVEIKLLDLNRSLSDDEDYLEEDRPRGLLRWDLDVPASARTGQPVIVDYTIEITYKKDVIPIGLDDWVREQ